MYGCCSITDLTGSQYSHCFVILSESCHWHNSIKDERFKALGLSMTHCSNPVNTLNFVYDAVTRPALWQHHWLWTGCWGCDPTFFCACSRVDVPHLLRLTLGLCELEHQLIKVSFIVKNNMYIKSQILGAAPRELQSGLFMAWTRSEPTTRCWWRK